MVVVMVLALLILLTAIGAQLGDSVVALEKFHRYSYNREVNYQMARSAMELATELIKLDNNSTDSAQDVWAFGSQRLTWEGKVLLLEIRDEESRFPLAVATGTNTSANATNTTANATNTTGNTTTNTTANTTTDTTANSTNTTTNSTDETATRQLYEKALERLLTRSGLPGRDAVATLQDWCDPDDEVRSGGAEQGSYPTIHVKNGPMDSLDELQLLQRWGPSTLTPPEPLQGGTLTSEEVNKLKIPLLSGGGTSTTSTWANVQGGSEWSDWLTLYSNGKVNLNTAPAEVIRCLDAQVSDTVVNELTSRRVQKVLKSQEDLRNLAGIDADLAFRLGKLSGFTSEHFRIRVVVLDDRPGKITLESMVRRVGREVKLLTWRVF